RGIAICIISIAQQASPNCIHMSEPVRAQAIRLSAVATRNPLSYSSLLTLVKNGSTAGSALPARAAISSPFRIMIAGSPSSIRALPPPLIDGGNREGCKEWAMVLRVVRVAASDEHAIAGLICDLGCLADERGATFSMR